MSKTQIRQAILSIRDNQSKKEVIEKSKAIENKVIKFLSKTPVTDILVYLSIKNEVQTDEIIKFLIKNKKRIYLPAFYETKNDWIIKEFASWDDLTPGPYNILQPKSSRRMKTSKLSAAIIPGVAFDRQGVRLGYGKGVYDKLLAASPAVKIGLAYDFQVVDKILKHKHDLIMDTVVTESRILKFT